MSLVFVGNSHGAVSSVDRRNRVAAQPFVPIVRTFSFHILSGSIWAANS